MKRRVVITGVGCYTPLGNNFNDVEQALFAGQTGLSYNETTGSMTGQVSYDADQDFDKFDIQVTDRIARLAYLAYRQAVAAAGVKPEGVYFGSGAGGASEIAKSYHNLTARGRVRPTSLVSSMLNGAANFIAAKDNINGPVFTYSAACSSASVAIGEAYKAISYGDVDVMVTGGGEFCLTKLVAEQWRAMQALSDCCKPFSEDRNGIALGEGTTIYILETLESAVSRGAKIYAEIVGYGNSTGAETMTKPNEAGQVSAMESALKGIDSGRVTYINAHGTGTPVGDLIELGSIAKVFGSQTQNIPVSSTKVLHGHLLGNAGGMELLACLAVLNQNKVIPNWGLSNPDSNIPTELNLPTKIIDKNQDIVLNNSFAFGGTNVVLALAKVDQ